MDSLSQAALGAAIGHAVLGRRVGRKAAAWGAAVATLPDLDVLVPLGNDVLDFTAHRGASHSLTMLALAAPPLAWAIGRIHRAGPGDRWRWALLVFLALWTHVLLDAFTAYGTQLFWPFTSASPVAWSTIFIIDPAYTLPLAIGLLIALLRPQRWHWNTAGLVLSTAYLLWTAAAQQHVLSRAQVSLAAMGQEVTQVLATPAPFNTLLWRVLAMEPDGDYLEGFHSLADGAGPDVAFRRYAGNRELLASVRETWAVQRLAWFSHGFYGVQRLGSRIVMADLRMGFEPFYVFSFAVAEGDDAGVTPLEGVQLPGPAWEPGDIAWVWHRIWERDAQPPRSAALQASR